jgi:hypothetical protein
VARAKRTERAEARRRYRAATTGAAGEGDDALETPEVPAAARPRDSRSRGRSSAGDPAVAAAARPGFIGTLRAAAGPVDILGDLRALPSIVLHSRAAWVPGVVILATTVALMIPSLSSNQIVVLAGNVVLQPPPMIIAFLAGMLAPRGAWLVGGLMGLLAGIAYVFVVTLNTDVLVTPLGWTYVVTSDQKIAYATNVLVTAPLFGVAVGAFAGFYRRFLNMSTPQRQQQARKR